MTPPQHEQCLMCGAEGAVRWTFRSWAKEGQPPVETGKKSCKVCGFTEEVHSEEA